MSAKHYLPSRKLSRTFREFKRTTEWQTMTFQEKHEFLFNHKIQLKALLNKEFYANRYGFTLKELENDSITDEDIKDLLKEEKIISEHVEIEMSSYLYGNQNKKKITEKTNKRSVSHLYR